MILAIDPGLTGALGFLNEDGTFHNVEDITTVQAGMGRKVKNEVNASDLFTKMGKLPVPSVVVIERVHSMPKMASQTVFSMGDSFGVVRAVAATLGIPTVFVDPRDWKKHFGLTSDKEQSRAKAVQLFPTAPLSRVKDHNRAESLLIARWLFETRN
jgi:crossover junction endodeoxyribonuclease RuvC